MSSKEIFALRRQNQFAQALAMARREYPSNSNDIWFIRAYAWCIFDHVKKIVTDYESNRMPPSFLSGQISPFMQEFSQIGLPLKGDGCFSQMLNLANKAAKDWDEFLYFAKWAGLDCFSDEDKKPYITESGDRLDSLQARYLRAVVREVSVRQNKLPVEILQWAEEVIKVAHDINPNDQWLYYYQSKIYLNNGNVDLAISSLIPVIHRQAKAYWVWGLLASILEKTDPENSLICYIYAGQLARSEQELAKLRITLAKKLSEKGRYAEAGLHVCKALEYRQSNNFKIPDELNQLQNSTWYQDVLKSNEMKKSPSVKEQALEILINLDKDNIVNVRGVIEHHNKTKEMAYVLFGTDEGMPIFYGKFPHVKNMEVGTVLEISYSKINHKKPVSIKVVSEKEIGGLCQIFTGVLNRVSDKNFAFIKSGEESVFVPPNLAEGYQHSVTYQVQCRVIKSRNKQGKLGWRAVEIANLE